MTIDDLPYEPVDRDRQAERARLCERMYPLMAKDSLGTNDVLCDEQELMQWLDSWLRDFDSMTCTLQKSIKEAE